MNLKMNLKLKIKPKIFFMSSSNENSTHNDIKSDFFVNLNFEMLLIYAYVY
jgi:hypothetical protein